MAPTTRSACAPIARHGALVVRVPQGEQRGQWALTCHLVRRGQLDGSLDGPRPGPYPAADPESWGGEATVGVHSVDATPPSPLTQSTRSAEDGLEEGRSKRLREPRLVGKLREGLVGETGNDLAGENEAAPGRLVADEGRPEPHADRLGSSPAVDYQLLVAVALELLPVPDRPPR